MKLALCFSGQPRTFKSAYPKIKEHILDKFDCDVFIFTFDKKDSSSIGLLNSWRYQDEGTIEEYLSLYKPKVARVEPYTDEMESYLAELEVKYKTQRSDNYFRRYIAMLYGIIVVNVMKNYKQPEYDYTIRIRPDISLTKFELPKGNLLIDHHGNGSSPNAVGDCFACGKTNEMNIYCNLSNIYEDYYNAGVPLNTEVLLEHHLKTHKLDYEVSHFVDKIIRPQSSVLSKEGFTG
jgi:hypothetical protein